IARILICLRCCKAKALFGNGVSLIRFSPHSLATAGGSGGGVWAATPHVIAVAATAARSAPRQRNANIALAIPTPMPAAKEDRRHRLRRWYQQPTSAWRGHE